MILRYEAAFIVGKLHGLKAAETEIQQLFRIGIMSLMAV